MHVYFHDSILNVIHMYGCYKTFFYVYITYFKNSPCLNNIVYCELNQYNIFNTFFLVLQQIREGIDISSQLAVIYQSENQTVFPRKCEVQSGPITHNLLLPKESSAQSKIILRLITVLFFEEKKTMIQSRSSQHSISKLAMVTLTKVIRTNNWSR